MFTYYFAVHCKKSWRKTPPAWPDVTDSLVRGTENFFDMKIELIRWVPTMKTEYIDISGIFLQLIWRVLRMPTDYFEINGIFLRFSILTRRSFPTIFRQLSDELIKINSSTSGIRPTICWVTIWYSTTVPLLHVLWWYILLILFVSTLFIFVNTVLFFVSTVLTVVSTVLLFFFISTQFTFVNAAFFFVSTVLNFVRTVLNIVRTVLNFVRTVLNFVRTVFFLVSTVLNLVSIACFPLSIQCWNLNNLWGL
jgi:hypothetical protein